MFISKPFNSNSNISVSQLKDVKAYSNECSTFKKNTDPRYQKVIQHVQTMNSVVVHDISISGEGTRGVYSILTELTFLRLCMENDLYHPHLYRWSVGVSIGSVIIAFILHARYLYECHSKKIALDYLQAIEDFLDFDNVRKIFYNLGKDKTLGDFAPVLFFKNLFSNGALCSREALVELIQANHKNFNFDNSKKYFESEDYYDWLDSNENLNNIFIVCYAQKKSRMVAFTGNEKRFENPTTFIKYEKLSYTNFINAVLCSSAILLLYPQPNINSSDGLAIDGARIAEITQIVHSHILTNVSFILPDNLLFTPVLLFFNITPQNNDNFLIIINKRNIQYSYENLLTFKQYKNPLINTFSSLLSVDERLRFNANTNVPLTALFLSQPLIKEFSINNVNKIFLSSLNNIQNTLQKNINLIRNSIINYRRIPTNLITENEFNLENDIYGVRKEFKTYENFSKNYAKYKKVTSNLVTSNHLYGYSQGSVIELLDKDYKKQVDENGNNILLTINILYTDVFIRTAFQGNENFNLDLLLNKDTKFLNSLLGMGFLSGNSTFDMHVKQSLYTVNKQNVKSAVLQEVAKEIEPIVIESVNSFLGSAYTNRNIPF